MISPLYSARRVATIAVAIGVLGGCAVLVVLVESPGGTGARPASLAIRATPAADPSPPVPAVTTPADLAGLRLMTEATAACRSVAFQGTQISDWWGPAGVTASVLQVWHRPGDSILARSSPTEGQAVTSQDVISLTAPLLAVMRAKYILRYAGDGSAAGHRARIVEIRRPGGSLAGRFWLDASTRLPLRRELFDHHGAMFSEDTFLGLTVGLSQLRGMPAAGAQPWTGQLSPSGLATLRAHGWSLPVMPPAGLALFTSTQTSTASGRVIELSYSDGLSVMSIFVQRGELPRAMPGWRRVPALGSKVYAIDPDDRSLAWSSRGFVYTVISDAPAAEVNQFVSRLPHDHAPGFWTRMSHGLRRIASWANPFG